MDLQTLQDIAKAERDRQKPVRVHCCTSTGCRAADAMGIYGNLQQAVKDQHLDDRVEVVGVGCMGFCGRGPLVQIDPDDRLYEEVVPDEAASIIEAMTGGEAKPIQGDPQHPFFARQMRVVREYSGKIDPERIEDYIAVGGYQALHKAIYEMTPAEVVDQVSQSGLRGRGGGGYPTGLKWATVAKMPEGQKYIICNGDEGDPGAFMDRSILESDPHLVLEGMAIAGYAVGANHGYIYVRAEYPLAIARLQKGIQQAKKYGLLGSQIFDSPFDFKIDIRIGAGAFVCGEETALIQSIEGGRGNPVPRPPYPAEKGLYDYPTLINNVETLANITAIIRNGADWYANIGTDNSKGTKIFALTGKIRNNGLIEVPMGITLRQIVEEMGGGVPDGEVKAVQTGGPSGGCIPKSMLDTPVDYDSLRQVGSMMGSGGMVVMDDATSMVGIAQFYMEFCRGETCGKCVPCRTGTVQLYAMLSKILKRQATAADLTKMEALCEMVRDTSLCGLGQTAPNPVLSTLKYFREEYEELLVEPDYLSALNGQATPSEVNA
ncbi:NuoF family protein [Nodosilinea sp. P-1105]|uniref:NuoF family protein n=1 Tax=Nodosilinea sp. P-1105 TaxID=2546229 RepID=UPI00146BCA54|nr:NuoF family protein [Nodosilinea sp. P-1105]NMF81872.1 NADH-quinone oxidoreductase subunit L [Nodosilinea sp. P-1105]